VTNENTQPKEDRMTINRDDCATHDRHHFGDHCHENCANCGTRIGMGDLFCTVDSGIICPPCGRTRYGDDLVEYVIVC
jgi:hypothetical protein